MARRVRVFVERVCKSCRGRGTIWYADSWDRDNGSQCSSCKGKGKRMTSYLREKPSKCKCRPGYTECCDICTGWKAYVKKHGHQPKDKTYEKV